MGSSRSSFWRKRSNCSPSSTSIRLERSSTYKIRAEAAFEYCAPEGTEPVFDPEAMQDIHQWITTEASNMIFIYGEVDPWSASAVQLTGGPTP